MRKRTPSLAQIAASRRNGTRSRGPATAAGKAVVAQNAIRHGLCAKSILLPGESEERFNLLWQGLLEEFNPQTTSEYLLLEEMAASAWRQRRAMAYETGFVADELAAGNLNGRQAWSRSADARLVSRYETGWRRAFHASLRDLIALAALHDNAEAPEPAHDNTPPLPNKPENSLKTEEDQPA